MKISYNWLKQYLTVHLSVEEIASTLTAIGLEVESIDAFESIKGGLKGVVVGEVKTCIKHPDADRLSVTTVDIGLSEMLPIVCGAPNVAAGQKVLVATIGTVLYAGNESFTIKKSKIRGEASEGMICAEDELGLGTSHEGILVLDAATVVGTPASQLFDVVEDTVFEIGLTPNRSDAMSHMGVARDLFAALRTQGHSVQFDVPTVDAFSPDSLEEPMSVTVEDQLACPRYSGVTIKDIQVKESPEWLKNKLKAIGLRPINNVVDVTNYILHDTGQPLHAFDLNQIKGNKVVVKKLPALTPFITLDEQERKLTGNDLMICNAQEGMCLAGVFGGLTSGVTPQTTAIFLESAYFDAPTIRKTSKSHDLKTDSSFRFERGTDPNNTTYALKRAALLIKEIAGGCIVSDVVDIYPKKIANKEITVSYAQVDRLIGEVIDRAVIKQILTGLDMAIISDEPHGLVLSVPTYKVDVTREVDVIEEILRIYGYNTIGVDTTLHSTITHCPKPDKERIQEVIADLLANNGFNEMMNNSLIKANAQGVDASKDVKIMNALSQDLSILRQHLLVGGLEAIAYNQNRRNADLKLFEFGHVYQKNLKQTGNALDDYTQETHLDLFICGLEQGEIWHLPSTKVSFYSLKAMVLGVLQRLGMVVSQTNPMEQDAIFTEGLTYKVNQKDVVSFGLLSAALTKSFDIKQEVYYAHFNWDTLLTLVKQKTNYTELSKYPEVRRDLALLIDSTVTFDQIKTVAFKVERQLLRAINLFDVYQGDKLEKGKKSYAVSFIFQDKEGTLTDKVIEKTMSKLITSFQQELGAVLR